jgi:hypothetical protein
MSHGQGPGEIFRLLDIAYDKEKDELIAYQHPFLYYFSSSGKFHHRAKLPFGFYNFTIIPEGYVFKTLDRQGNEHLDSWDDYTLLVTDKKFKLKSVGLSYAPNEINYGGYNYLYKNNNTISVTQRFTDTVYHYFISTNLLTAKYVLDYSKKELPKQYLEGSKKEFDDAISNNDYYYYLGEYLESDSHCVFVLMNDYIRFNTIIYRDKLSGNLRGGTHGNYDDVNEIPAMGFPFAISETGNYFISVHFPHPNDSLLSNSSIISEEDKLKVKNLTEDDNPVLVLFKLKNF